MSKIGRPGIDGQKVLVKIQKELLTEIDQVWPKIGYASRNDFIRRVLWNAVKNAKKEVVGA